MEQYDLVPDDLMCFRVSVAEISLGLPEKPWLGKEAIGFTQKSLLSTICSAKNEVLCHVLSIFSGQWWHWSNDKPNNESLSVPIDGR